MTTARERPHPSDEAVVSSVPPEPTEGPAGARSVNRWLLALVLALAAALVGLGAWTFVDRGGRASDAQSLGDKMRAAWSSYDRAAIASIYAREAQLRTTGAGSRGTTLSGNASIGGSVSLFKLEGVKLSRMSGIASSGEFAASFDKWTSTMGGAPETVLNVIQVRGGKIVRQWTFWLGLGVFDNVSGEAA